MDEWEIPKQVAGGAGVTAMLALAIAKGISFLRSEQAAQNGSTATSESFKTLRLQIEALQADNVLLRKEFHVMDTKLHRQQTKLTRTEMLVRQFMGLVKEHGVTVPGYMQEELDDILEERPVDSRTRATDSKETT